MDNFKVLLCLFGEDKFRSTSIGNSTRSKDRPAFENEKLQATATPNIIRVLVFPNTVLQPRYSIRKGIRRVVLILIALIAPIYLVGCGGGPSVTAQLTPPSATSSGPGTTGTTDTGSTGTTDTGGTGSTGTTGTGSTGTGSTGTGGTGSTDTGGAGTPLFSQVGSTLTISNCLPGQSILYRTDSGKVTIASTLYSGPITVTTDEVVSAICATIGAYQTNLQSESSGAACGVGPSGSPSTTTFGSWTCQNSGGTGTLTPSNLVWAFGTTNTATITAPANSGSSVQALFKWQFGGSVDPRAPTCDTCTEQVKDIKFTVIGTGLENQEFDSPQYDRTHGNTDRQNGTQCQGPSGLIEVDSGNAGGWTQTTASCSTWTNGTTHEVVNRVDHDLSGSCPGGRGCALYKYIWIDGVLTKLLGNYSNTQGYSRASGTAWGWQFQPDMRPTGGSAVTGGWTIISATVALGIGDESAVASYTAS